MLLIGNIEINLICQYLKRKRISKLDNKNDEFCLF